MRTIRVACVLGLLLAGLTGCTAQRAAPAVAASPSGAATASPSEGTAGTAPSPSTGAQPASPPAPQVPGGTGVAGLITVAGVCPVPMDNDPCLDHPIAARITVRRTGATAVLATAQSGTDGRYRIALAPGDYTLFVSALNNGLVPRPAETAVTVAPGRYVTADVRLQPGRPVV